jgi:hypothetical protein
MEDHALPKIKTYLARFRVRTLYIVGHSYGAATASVFTMILRERHLTDLRKVVGDFDTADSEGRGFRMHCFAFACPPVVSAELAESAKSWIESYVNENDIVPRLGFGTVLDFRDLVLHASKLIKAGISMEVGIHRFAALIS